MEIGDGNGELGGGRASAEQGEGYRKPLPQRRILFPSLSVSFLKERAILVPHLVAQRREGGDTGTSVRVTYP
jgi:hypothetical protein